MNDVLDILILIAVLGLASVWITAVFCYALMIFGGFEDDRDD